MVQTTVTEFILNEDTIIGTFVTSEEIRGTSSDDSDTFIKGNSVQVYQMKLLLQMMVVY